ncbi:MAG: DUF3226 domain-containing protein [Saprospiraceae bacterium]
MIVESHNDKAFIALLLENLGIDAELDVIVEHLHKFEDEIGQEKRGKEAIGAKLKSLKRDLGKKYPNIEKIGIILDFDYPPRWNFKNNLTLINNAFNPAFGTSPTLFSKESEFVKVDENLQSACFFIKVTSNSGNLDTLLFEIRKDPAEIIPYADCLKLWRDCVNDPKNQSKLKVSSNTFAKLWLDNLLRAKAKEMGNKGRRLQNDFEARKSNLITNIGASVFDLEHTALKPLRDFLLLFKSSSPNT